MSQLQSKLSAEKIPAEQWDQHLNYKVKNIQDLSDTLFVFEIFEIAQKNKKVSYLQLPTRQLPGMPVCAQACPVWVS